MPETITTNPFSTCHAVGFDVTIYLGQNVPTEVPIMITCSGTLIKGTGSSGSEGFYAAASFCSGAYASAPGCTTDGYPIIEIGNTPSPVFVASTRIEDMILNCKGVINCTPFVGSGLMESSGARNVYAIDYLGVGFSLTTRWTGNFVMEDLTAEPAATSTTAVGIEINGIDMDGNAIKQFTMAPYSGGHATACVDVENSSAYLTDIHCENSTTGILVNNSRYLIIGYNTGQGALGTITDHIKIIGTSYGSLFDMNADNPNYGTNMINNTATGFLLTVATTNKLISYWSGNSTDGECWNYPGLGGVNCSGPFRAKSIGVTNSVVLGTYEELVENTSPGGSAGKTRFYANSTSHWPMMNPNNAGDNKILLAGSGANNPLQVKRVSGCATGAVQFSTCDTLVTWPNPFPDTNYTATCTGADGTVSGVPALQGHSLLSNKLAASIEVRTIALSSAAAQFTTIECTAMHD